jgi:hypothetical protein
MNQETQAIGNGISQIRQDERGLIPSITACGKRAFPLAIANGTAHVQAATRTLSTFGKEVVCIINPAGKPEGADMADLYFVRH